MRRGLTDHGVCRFLSRDIAGEANMLPAQGDMGNQLVWHLDAVMQMTNGAIEIDGVP
jgi:hypothetical protein